MCSAVQLYIARIPHTATEDQTKEVFGAHGIVKEVILFRNHPKAPFCKVGAAVCLYLSAHFCCSDSWICSAVRRCTCSLLLPTPCTSSSAKCGSKCVIRLGHRTCPSQYLHRSSFWDSGMILQLCKQLLLSRRCCPSQHLPQADHEPNVPIHSRQQAIDLICVPCTVRVAVQCT